MIKADESNPTVVKPVAAMLVHPKLCTKQAAAFLGLSVSLLNKLRCTGGGPQFIKIGSRCLYDVNDLESWVAQKKQHHT